jgi:phosphomannomutase
MTLIKSISGIRGTIGGEPGLGLTPSDILKFTAAFGTWVSQQALSRGNKGRVKVVVGRDARISGPMVQSLILGTLSGLGIDVIDIGMATTPTVEIAVTGENAEGGIIITASHNPKEWNAMKLLNEKGEFLNGPEGNRVLEMADEGKFVFASVETLGRITRKDYTDRHIEAVLALPLVDVESIRSCRFRISVDAVNSVGGVVIPRLLRALGVAEVVELNCTPDGVFAHNPEPLPAHLTEISALTKSSGCHAGFVVDPDVDRLAVINEDGSMFGEEYTLVAVSDYVLRHTPGNTVSNLSSSRALRDQTRLLGGKYFAAAVGEVNVVAAMKEHKAVIGGEGNGGVIYPELHYGRDALVGVALFLTWMARSGKTPSVLKSGYPVYFMSKQRIDLKEGVDVDALLKVMKERYARETVTDIDGVKIDFEKEWVHLRKSNTEPIIRVYTESGSQAAADALAHRVMSEILSLT